jgi:hypothetical protein
VGRNRMPDDDFRRPYRTAFKKVRATAADIGLET